MRIAVDAMGGDFAPKEIVAGALLAADELNAQLSLVGRPEEIERYLGKATQANGRVEIAAAEDVISMGESPRAALRGRDDSSVARAVAMVGDGSAQAVVSAGNSGAFMALSTVRLGTIPGVKRPAIAITVPVPGGSYRVLLDAGANADCRPEHLRDFGVMGALYAQHALHIETPRVGLLSIGQEKGKGNELTKTAHDLLEETDLNFIGNVEGGDIFTGGTDVIVCDGFTGNVVLKTTEGVGAAIFGQIRESIAQSTELSESAPLFEKALRCVANQFDYSEYGGALLLGVNGVSVVGHGCSNANAIRNAIRFAYRAVEGKMVEHISTAFAERAKTGD